MPNGTRHILIVDDDEDIRTLLKVSLQEKGYVCHTADSAKAAIEVLNTESVDLTLIDIIMPEVTGLSLFKHVRDTFPDVAVVFVTTVDDMNLALDCVKDGADDYIIKSEIPVRLIQAVGQALKRHDAVIERDRHLRNLKGLVEHQAVALQHRSQEITDLNQMFSDWLAG